MKIHSFAISLLVSIAFSMSLTSCGALPISPTPTPPPTRTSTLTAAPTKTEIPTPEPESVITQKDILDAALNRQEDFSYLQSNEYKQLLEREDVNGELPSLPSEPNLVRPGLITLRFDTPPSKFLIKYFVESAISFPDSARWMSDDKKPFTLVDAGFTAIGDAKVGFFVVKWKNTDAQLLDSFWGFLFVPQTLETSATEFEFWYDLNGEGYPMPGHFTSVEGCKKYTERITAGQDVTEYCEMLGTNPDSALPKDAIRAWNNDGNLILDRIPWSQAMPSKIGYK